MLKTLFFIVISSGYLRLAYSTIAYELNLNPISGTSYSNELNIFLNKSQLVSVALLQKSNQSDYCLVVLNDLHNLSIQKYNADATQINKAYLFIKAYLKSFSRISMIQILNTNFSTKYVLLIEAKSNSSTQTKMQIEQIHGQVMFIITIMLTYSLLVFLVLVRNVKPRRQQLKANKDVEIGEFLLKSMHNQTVNKVILEQLRDKEYRAKAWDIYNKDRLDKDARFEEKLLLYEDETLKKLDKHIDHIKQFENDLINKHLIVDPKATSMRYQEHLIEWLQFNKKLKPTTKNVLIIEEDTIYKSRSCEANLNKIESDFLEMHELNYFSMRGYDDIKRITPDKVEKNIENY